MLKINSEEEFKQLCNWCIQKEPKLEKVVQKFDYPPFWYRKANFQTLLLTILEQQVSLASAKATYNKLAQKIKTITPKNTLKLNEQELRACGFSRQKTKYTQLLASEIEQGKLSLDEINDWDEPEIRTRLIQLKGIGNWTIDMYVLMSLHFSDIFPPGDLATIKAVYELNLVEPGASKDEIVSYMTRFSPYRSAATYLLWHYYIQKRNLKLE